MSFSLNSILQSFVPKDRKFFPLLRQASLNLVECARTLRHAMNADAVTRINAHRLITEQEHQGDDITHFIFKESAQTFLTPFDREDIQELAHTLDDVTDYLHAVSKRIELYKIHQMKSPVLEMIDLIFEACEKLNYIIHEMHHLRFTPEIRAAIATIRENEKAVDVLFDDAIGELFREKSNAVEILKQKELLTELTSAADRAEQTSSVIEAVLLKFQ